MRKRGEFFLTEKLELKNVGENKENRKSPVAQHGIVAGKFYQRLLKLRLRRISIFIHYKGKNGNHHRETQQAAP